MMITMMNMIFFSPPTIEEKINYDYNMPPIYDDYGDENNNDSYFVEYAPTIFNKKNFAFVESINSFMHVTHDKNVLCDSYIVNFIHDATKVIMREGNMVLCISIIFSFLSLCWNFLSCTYFVFLCESLCASLTCFSTRLFCI